MHAQKKPYRPCKRFVHHLPVRATPAEQERITTLARDASLSASRYLVRCALEGRPPPDAEEREELRHLRFYLAKVSSNLNQLAHRSNLAALRGSKPPADAEIAPIVKAAGLVIREITRRLGGRR